MKVICTRTLSSSQFEQINAMWNHEYPLKLKDRFPLLLEGVDRYEHYLIEDADQNVLAWAVDFEKDEQIRFSIIVSEAHKGRGLGRMLLDRLKENNKEFYGWVIDHNHDVKANGEQYLSPMSFYLKHGFEILTDKRIDSEMIKAVLIKWSAQ
ncbi:MAG TPA: GNAT family N-acetyltransferase [Bacteroidia bacterium]